MCSGFSGRIPLSEEVRAVLIGERSRLKGEREKNRGLRPKDKGEGGETIYSGEEKILHSNYKVICIEDLMPLKLSPSALHLSFLTPTRLKYIEI